MRRASVSRAAAGPPKRASHSSRRVLFELSLFQIFECRNRARLQAGAVGKLTRQQGRERSIVAGVQERPSKNINLRCRLAVGGV